MIKKSLILLFALFLCIGGIFAAEPYNDDDSSDSSGDGNGDSGGIEDRVKGDVITFSQEVTLDGHTGTKFRLDKGEDDYIEVIQLRRENPSLTLESEGGHEDLYGGVDAPGVTGSQDIYDFETPDEYENIKSNCEENPQNCDSLDTLKEYDDSFNPTQGYSKIYDDIESLEDKDDLSDEDQEELENKKEFLKSSMTGTDFVNMVGDKDSDKLAEIFNDCSGFTCWFKNKIDAETLARESIVEARERARGDAIIEDPENCPDREECISPEDYNQRLDEEIENQIDLDALSGESCESVDSCDVTEIECGDEDDKCHNNKEMIQVMQDEKRQQEAVQLEGAGAVGYGIASALLNIDQRALQASEFFGFESRFHDLPEVLQEDFPSQICMYEIDGYLDEQRTTTTNNVRGSTQYGCLNEESTQIDRETGKVETFGGNCLNVVGDIRAQRTPLTPDDTVEISYSGFVKAPPGNSITAEVFAVYNLDGETREEKLYNATVSGDDEESFFKPAGIIPNENLDINFSNFDDDQTIEIRLKATKSGGGKYLDMTTNAYKITEGTAYQDPLSQ